jgi:hypothetical protein
MILAGQEGFNANGSRLVTMWEWESGIALSAGNNNAFASMMEDNLLPPTASMNATTTATTDHSTSDPNVTSASEEHVVEEAVRGAVVAE